MMSVLYMICLGQMGANTPAGAHLLHNPIRVAEIELSIKLLEFVGIYGSKNSSSAEKQVLSFREVILALKKL